MKGKLLAILVLITLLPYNVSATLVRYDFIWAGGPSIWQLDAFVELDSANLLAGTNLVGSFTSWGMSWTDGVTSYSVDSTADSLWPSSDFQVDSAWNVVLSNLCTNDCATHPAVRIGLTDAAASIQQGLSARISGAWSGPITVPEPAPLLLLGAGLLALVLKRCRTGRDRQPRLVHRAVANGAAA